MWTLVPLGNPGTEYQDTRHNLGRLMLQRWMENHRRVLEGSAQSTVRSQPPAMGFQTWPGVLKRFSSGALYGLSERLQALVPGTYMNLSGEVCAQADAAGIYARRMILLYDDKDLPLGQGRFRLDGSDGGHNGLRSVFHHLGTERVARLRLGIGPFERPLADYVLGPWTEGEWQVIDRLDEPFAAFMDRLAEAEALASLPNVINPEGFWRGER